MLAESLSARRRFENLFYHIIEKNRVVMRFFFIFPIFPEEIRGIIGAGAFRLLSQRYVCAVI